MRVETDTQTHTFDGPFCGTTRVSRYEKGKTISILLKQKTMSGSGISWAICKSAPSCRQITTPATPHSVFLQAACPSCCPANSGKVLKEKASLHRTVYSGWDIAVCFCAAFMIAGNTAQYVNSELEKVAKKLVTENE